MILDFKNDKVKNKVIKIFYFSIFVITTYFLLKKCSYGFGNLDESFYLTMPLRYVQGDGMFSDEWHLSMMSGYIMYPLMAIYVSIFKSTESMIINFRYIYLFFWCITSLIIFFNLKKYTLIGAAFSSLMFLIYDPYNIMALSYNTMCLMFLILSLILFVTNDENKRVINYLIGTFYSLSVLCCPPLAIIIVLYLIYVLINRNGMNENKFLYIALGILTQFILFVVFVFSRATIEQIVKSFPLIFADGEHSQRTILEIIKNYFLSYKSFYSIKMQAIFVAVIIIGYFDKNRIKHNSIYLITIFVVIGTMSIRSYINNNYINFVMYPISLLGLVAYIFDKEDMVLNRLFKFFWIPGFIYSIAIHLCSDQVQYEIFSAYTVSAIISIIMIFLYITKNYQQKYSEKIIVLCCCMTLLIMQIGFEFNLRWYSVYWEDSILTQEVKITDGPDKNIYVTQERYDMYYENMNLINDLNYNGNSILYLSLNPWLYLYKDSKYSNSSYSAWLASTPSRLMSYYEMNPEKIPDNIYAEEEYFDNAEDIANKYGLKLVDSGDYWRFYTK